MNPTVSWYITFGFGGPYGGQYTEIKMPLGILTRTEHSEIARKTAFEVYGTAWAFHYGPDQFEQSIARYGMKLREVIEA